MIPLANWSRASRAAEYSRASPVAPKSARRTTALHRLARLDRAALISSTMKQLACAIERSTPLRAGRATLHFRAHRAREAAYELGARAFLMLEVQGACSSGSDAVVSAAGQGEQRLAHELVKVTITATGLPAGRRSAPRFPHERSCRRPWAGPASSRFSEHDPVYRAASRMKSASPTDTPPGDDRHRRRPPRLERALRFAGSSRTTPMSMRSQRARQHAVERVAIAVVHLARLQHRADRGQFVAGRKKRHAQAPAHRHFAEAERGDQSQFGRTDLLPA